MIVELGLFPDNEDRSNAWKNNNMKMFLTPLSAFLYLGVHLDYANFCNKAVYLPIYLEVAFLISKYVESGALTNKSFCPTAHRTIVRR